ncbi:Uncharacterised protein [uncultured archaeon]|nr:Uncharacterised protein [uncultured archaeon]
MTMKKEIINFIISSKKKGYASTKDIFVKSLDGGKSCFIQKGNLVYTDTYFGSRIDCGQERVYEDGKVIWVMAYRGGIIKLEELHNEAFNFLKKCISKMPKNFPARGPRSLKEGPWKYENIWKGTIKSFTGEENIYYNGEKICFRNYLGGLIKNKE